MHIGVVPVRSRAGQDSVAGFAIRSCDVTALAGLTALQASIFPDDDAEGAEELALALTPGIETAEGFTVIDYWGLYFNGRPVGLVGLYALRSTPGDAWLGWFGIDASVRGQGLGSVLLDHAAKQAAQRGFRHLRLWTTDKELDGTCLAKFYFRHGFAPTAYPMASFKGHSVYLFSRSLGAERVPTPLDAEPDAWVVCGRAAA